MGRARPGPRAPPGHLLAGQPVAVLEELLPLVCA
jgi:hypothetical protein